MSWTDLLVLSEGLVVEFAAAELRKYAEKSGVTLAAATVVQKGTIVLAATDDLADDACFSEAEKAEFASWSGDGFAILSKAESVYIIGANERSVLFGVYHFCKEMFGYRWVTLADGKPGKMETEIKPLFHEPKLKRRGFVFETINEPDFMLKMVDWLAKHYINEIFFTFYLWDELRDVLEGEIKKRGMNITLGGHSLGFLMNKESTPGHKQVNFGDETWQNEVIEKIKGFSMESSPVTRISLWPEDTGVEDRNLLKGYIKFTERIQEALPKLAVEHIAYNAGLSWQMLELGEGQHASEKIDTLYAFWGRNYHKPADDHSRAFTALKVWKNETGKAGRDLTIFEYYSDHYMLSDLFPPLFNRIKQDIEEYAALGIEGMTNLVVPYRPKKNGLAGKYDHLYPWREIQLMNGYFYSRLSWGDKYEKVADDFFSSFGDQAREWMNKLENTLSQASKWNIPLFPSRLMDPEQVKGDDFKSGVISHLAEMKEVLESLKEEAGLPTIEEWLIQHQDLENWKPEEILSFYLLFLNEKLEEYIKKWGA